MIQIEQKCLSSDRKAKNPVRVQSVGLTLHLLFSLWWHPKDVSSNTREDFLGFRVDKLVRQSKEKEA